MPTRDALVNISRYVLPPTGSGARLGLDPLIVPSRLAVSRVLAHSDGDILFNAAELLNSGATGRGVHAYDHPAASLAYRGASRVLARDPAKEMQRFVRRTPVEPP